MFQVPNTLHLPKLQQATRRRLLTPLARLVTRRTPSVAPYPTHEEKHGQHEKDTKSRRRRASLALPFPSLSDILIVRGAPQQDYPVGYKNTYHACHYPEPPPQASDSA